MTDKHNDFIGETVQITNTAYIPQIIGCKGKIVGSREVYFPMEGENITFYDVEIVEPSPDYDGGISGSIGDTISTPKGGFTLDE